MHCAPEKTHNSTIIMNLWVDFEGINLRGKIARKNFVDLTFVYMQLLIFVDIDVRSSLHA